MMSISSNDVKLCMYSIRKLIFHFIELISEHLLASFPVGEAGTNVTTVTFGHRSGKLLATGGDDNTIHIYVIGQMTSLLVRLMLFVSQIVLLMKYIYLFRRHNAKNIPSQH